MDVNTPYKLLRLPMQDQSYAKLPPRRWNTLADSAACFGGSDDFSVTSGASGAASPWRGRRPKARRPKLSTPVGERTHRAAAGGLSHAIAIAMTPAVSDHNRRSAARCVPKRARLLALSSPRMNTSAAKESQPRGARRLEGSAVVAVVFGRRGGGLWSGGDGRARRA